MKDNIAELVELAKFLKVLRQAVLKSSGLTFVDSSMWVLNNPNIWVLNNPYYIRIFPEKIEINCTKAELEISNSSSLKLYYHAIALLFDGIYYKKETQKQSLIRIDFILERIASGHSALITKAETELMYASLHECI